MTRRDDITFTKGTQIRVTVTFNDGSSNVDPDNVFFKLIPPTGASDMLSYQYGVDGELVKSTTGIYYVLVDGDVEGKYLYRFYSTGSAKAAVEGEFYIKETVF